MTNETETARVYPVGHLQGFVDVLPESGNYQSKLAVRNGSSIWHVPSVLAESFIHVIHKSPTVAEYDEWAKRNGVDENCDLSDLMKHRIAVLGLDDVERNPLMFKFRPSGETAISFDSDGYCLPSGHDVTGICVHEPAFLFWIESFDASSVHDAIERVSNQLGWVFKDTQEAVMSEMDKMLQSGSGRLEYLNLASPKGNWYFAG